MRAPLGNRVGITMRSCLRACVPARGVLLRGVAGCSKDKDVEPPAELSKFPQKLNISEVWSAGVGNGKKQMQLRLGLGPAVDDGMVFAASHKGRVEAFALKNGQRRWQKDTKLPLAGGPAAGFGLVVLGASKGQIIALDEKTGAERWRTRVNGELLSAPAIGEQVVAVRSVDGKLHGLESSTGKELWSVEQPVPRLSLRGTAIPVIAKDMVISGFDNGKVMAVTLDKGDTVWDTALASPHGKTELERLVDIDSTVQVAGDNVYAVGFQGRVAMLALDSGQIWWAHDMSSYRGLSVQDDTLYVSSADGSVVALRGRDGSEVWRNDQLKRRGLSMPVVTSNAVAVADFQGYVHWLDRSNGQLIAREHIKKERVTNPPVAADDTVVVLTDGGKLAAFRAKSKAR
jgi:outer membrane protein assembly factor BamB